MENGVGKGERSAKEMLNTLSQEKHPDHVSLWEFLLVLKLEAGHWGWGEGSVSNQLQLILIKG